MAARWILAVTAIGLLGNCLVFLSWQSSVASGRSYRGIVEDAASQIFVIHNHSHEDATPVHISRDARKSKILTNWKHRVTLIEEKWKCRSNNKRQSIENLCDCLTASGYYDANGMWKSCGYKSIASFELLDSYLDEMTERMKIFILPIDGLITEPIGDYGNGGYQLESYFYRTLTESPMRVFDPEEATAFFLPFFSADLYSMGNHTVQAKIIASEEFANHANQAMKFLNVQNVSGADQKDHQRSVLQRIFTMISHDDGVNMYTQYAPKPFVRYSRFIVNTADYMDYSVSKANRYLPNKDVSAVCSYNAKRQKTIGKRVRDELREEGRSLCDGKREVYAYFAGSLVSNEAVRIPMAESFNDTKYADSIVKSSRLFHGTEYARELVKAKYCLCPAGKQKWSPRMIESIWAGCVPVFIMDFHQLPLSCFFDWNSFSVVIPEDQAYRTAEILYSISAESYGQMCENLSNVRQYFQYTEPSPDPNQRDAFSLTMLELYLRQEVCPAPVGLPSLEDLRMHGVI